MLLRLPQLRLFPAYESHVDVNSHMPDMVRMLVQCCSRPYVC